MATERMRLEAEMKDSASPVIAKLRKELTELQNVTRESRAIGKLNSELATLRKEAGGVRVSPGMNAVGGWFVKTGTEAAGFAKSVGGASTAFNALGIGGLTAAASIGGLAAAMREMGNRTLAMRELGREIGTSTDYINAFGRAGQHFGVGADAMQGALDHLAGQMPEFKRGYGELFQELSRWPDLIAKLKADKPEDQIKDIFTFLGQGKLQNEPQLQKQILGSIFGNGADMEKLFANGAQGFLAELQRQQAKLGTISPDLLKAAQDYRDAQIGFTDSLEKFETTVGPRFLGVMTGIIDKATEFFDPDRSKIEKKQRDGGARDERERSGGTEWMNDPRVRDALRKKSGFDGDGRGLLHLSSFDGAGGSTRLGDGADIIAAGTRIGFLAAMREYASTSVASAGAGGGIINASLGGSTGGAAAGFGGGGSGQRGGGFTSLAGANLRGGDASGEHADWIRSEAKRLGIDPRVAVAVAKSEGLGTAWGSGMDHGTSFGDYQLHVGGGLGDIFRRQGGRLAPDNWKAMDTFALEHAAKNGWGPWHGAARIGIHGMAGIGGRPSGAADVPGANNHLGLGLRTLSEECVALAKAAVGANASVTTWRKGVSALDGTLKPGTPIATFMDRFGRASDRYAGGGTGTRGANRDHAGIFQDYIRDANGKAIGMHIAEQFRGSHGPHSRAYMFGQGVGERNGSAYSAIMGADGRPLGGDRNPLANRLNEYEVRRANGLEDRSIASAKNPAAGSRHELDIRLHDHNGHVQSTSMKSSGHGLHPRLQRWPSAPGVIGA